MKTRKKSGGHVRANVGDRMTCTIRMNREHEAAGPFFGHVGDCRMTSSRFVTRAPNAKRFCGFQARPLYCFVLFATKSPFEFLMDREIENKGDKKMEEQGSGGFSRFSFPSTFPCQMYHVLFRFSPIPGL